MAEESKTTVVNVKVAYIRPRYNNLAEWCQDPDNVYIARGGIVFIDGARYPPRDSIWANPYKIGKDGDRDVIIEKYRSYILNKLETGAISKEQLLALKGKNLGCWCKEPSKRVECHGDVLLELIELYDK